MLRDQREDLRRFEFIGFGYSLESMSFFRGQNITGLAFGVLGLGKGFSVLDQISGPK